MDAADLDRPLDWVVRRGLAGVPEADLMRAFCEKINAAGLPLSRGLALMSAGSVMTLKSLSMKG